MVEPEVTKKEYYYQAFGVPIISEIQLPALLSITKYEALETPVFVKLGTVPDDLEREGHQADKFTFCNPNEMLYKIPDKIKFYISNGKNIVIEPINKNYSASLIYFYSNALAAILFQRNRIPFHVSGVFTDEGKVVLFAAPSGTGKSTLSVKLQELGYRPFTDDTATLYIENGKCYAQASYPMIRLWQKTLSEQTILHENDKQKLYDDDDDLDKYGFSFHEKFVSEPVEVQQIIFLSESGTDLLVKEMKKLDAFTELANNVYRCHWIPAMQKSKEQFNLISHILNLVPFVLAVRPKGLESFSEFANMIKKIL